MKKILKIENRLFDIVTRNKYKSLESLKSDLEKETFRVFSQASDENDTMYLADFDVRNTFVLRSALGLAKERFEVTASFYDKNFETIFMICWVDKETPKKGNRTKVQRKKKGGVTTGRGRLRAPTQQ